MNSLQPKLNFEITPNGGYAANPVVFASVADALQILATKDDLSLVRDAMRTQTMWFAAMLIGQRAAIVALQNLAG